MHQNFPQWSEGQFKELSPFDEYRAGRDQVVPYAPPVQTPAPYESKSEAAVELALAIFKPAVVLSILSGTVWVIVASLVAVTGAMLAWVSANAVWIGGVGFCTVFLFISLASFFRSDETSAPSGASGGQGQTINVTINVSGQNVTTNSK